MKKVGGALAAIKPLVLLGLQIVDEASWVIVINGIKLSPYGV